MAGPVFTQKSPDTVAVMASGSFRRRVDGLNAKRFLLRDDRHKAL